MVDPATAKQLADAGGWAAFLVLGSLVAVGWFRQWFVHGDLYRKERDRADKLAADLIELSRTQARAVTSYDRLRAAVMAVLRERGDRRNAPS